MKTIKAVAFDMDGTLFSSDGLLEQTYKQSLAVLNAKYDLNIVAPTQEIISPHLGKPNHEIYKEIFPSLDPALFPELKDLNTTHFSILLKEQGGTIFNGTLEMLEDLKNHDILRLIASNGAMQYLTSIVEKYELPFNLPIITLDYTDRFVKADILSKYLEDYALSPDEVIMVGDRIMDKEAAQAHKITFIGVSGKTFGSSNELAGSDYIVENIKEVHKLLKTLIGY